uniref:Putative polyprotein n=1 Tax=Albugo laibachii Nc14 TaxID=890382 RepID=F0WTT1_9STRA|nr:putative polyprotein [Albugo laibachii Nc14]|eukprot:CCA24775.1 putative polyprotein [Albugo laibachii Nc14]
MSNGTRPDVSFAVGQLSRHPEHLSEEHWKAAIRLLRYLKTTASKGIIFEGRNGPLEIGAFYDADWASNKDNWKSVSGILIMVNGAPVVFKSKVQQKVLWLKAFLQEIEACFLNNIVMYEENQSAIAIAENDGYQSRAKHIYIWTQTKIYTFHFCLKTRSIQHIYPTLDPSPFLALAYQLMLMVQLVPVLKESERTREPDAFFIVFPVRTKDAL